MNNQATIERIFFVNKDLEIKRSIELDYGINDTSVKLYNKEYLYNSPNEDAKTKMYLIKNDTAEVIETKNNWIQILYKKKGQNNITAWLPLN